MQRRAIDLVAGRGTVGEWYIALDWCSDTFQWPRQRLCAEAVNLDLDGCEELLGQLRAVCAAAPAWTLADLGGRPYDASYSRDEERPTITVSRKPDGTLTVTHPGQETITSRTLTAVPSTATAGQIKRAFKAMAKDAERLHAWAQRTQQPDTHLWAYLSRQFPDGDLTVQLTASRGAWEDREERKTVWNGPVLDLDTLEVPAFDAERAPLLDPADVIAALRQRYDFRGEGVVPGATFYHPKHPMFDFDE